MALSLLTPKQSQIVDLKTAGKSNMEIGRIVYPKATPHSGRMQVGQVLNSATVQAYLKSGRDDALKAKGINWLKIISKLSIMLDANKNIYSKDGEIIASEPDIQAQQFAIKTVIPLLSDNEDSKPNAVNEQLGRALQSGDVTEAYKLVFNKNNETPLQVNAEQVKSDSK